MLKPLKIGSFTDFSSSINHAHNIAEMFKGKDGALHTSFVHMPIAYHSRSSSLVISGTDIRRPKCQFSEEKKTPKLSATKQMDFELELATVIGKSS